MLKRFFSVVILVVGLVLAGAVGAAPLCTPQTPVGGKCEIVLGDVHLTQTSVGKVAVACKRLSVDRQVQGILNGATPTTDNVAAALNEYLAANDNRILPLVIGPNKKFYTTDHHHLGTAVWTYKENYNDYDRSKVRFQAQITVDWSNTADITMDNFWEKMAAANQAWPYDNNGDKLTGRYTSEDGPYPQSFGQTKNDKYRSLSRWVRESCLYIKEGKEQCKKIAKKLQITPNKGDFEEFVWANYLRQNLPWPKGKENEIDKLKEIYKKTPEEMASKDAKAFLMNLQYDPKKYGYNKKGLHLKLVFDGGCEDPTHKIIDK